MRNILILCAFLILIACQEGQSPYSELRCRVDPLIGSESDITGTWKVVKGEVIPSTNQEGRAEDYSCDNIMFHFDMNGGLTIISDLEDYIGIDSGEYDYEVIEQSQDEERKDLYLLRIDNNRYLITMTDSEMKIVVNPISPLILPLNKIVTYLIRVE